MNMTYCTYCKCDIPKTYPKFTHHYHIDAPKPNYSIVESLLFPFAFWQVINDNNSNGPEFESAEIINVCSQKCFLLMENHKKNHSIEMINSTNIPINNDRPPNKKAKII